MTVIKYSDDVLGWKRKPGPVRVWRVVDGLKKTVDGKTLRFSIQEVPEDRYNDVLDHLCTFFIKDEPLCKHNKIVDKPEEISDFFQLWGLAFGQGAIVGAFLVEEDNPKPKLVGVNMTLVHTESSDKAWETALQLTGVISKKIVGFMSELDKVANVKERYKVDKYLTAYGLSVDPQYRGQGLGLQLLEARNDMAAAYDLKATSTSFTAVPAQKVAERAGFELLVEKNYADLKNEDGTEMFPEEKSSDVSAKKKEGIALGEYNVSAKFACKVHLVPRVSTRDGLTGVCLGKYRSETPGALAGATWWPLTRLEKKERKKKESRTGI